MLTSPPSPDVLTVEGTLYGPLDVPDWPDDLILRALRDHGEWSETEVAVLGSVLQPGEAFWDVGAFLGTFSLGLSRHVALGRVCAIEANAALGPFLTSNLARNLPCPSRAVTSGVGHSSGWIRPRSAEVSVNHGAQDYEYAPDAAANAIACRSLKSLRQTCGDYDVLKLDIEGMELDALRGDIDYIRARKPVLWVECNEDHRSLEVFAALKWLGYDPVYLAFPAFRTRNVLGATDLIYPMAYEAALLAATPDRLARLDPHRPGEDVICRKPETALDLRRALYDTPRWCPAGLANLSRAELIAHLGRKAQGIALQDFLPG